MIRKIISNLVRKTIRFVCGYMPEYKTSGSACFDLQAHTTHTLRKNELFNFGTDLRCEIPNGWCLLVFARSSLGQKKLIIPNSVGVIDSDYRGQIKVPILSLNDEDVTIEKGQRIAQALLVRAEHAFLQRATSLSDTTRGEGGFGSTGQ